MPIDKSEKSSDRNSHPGANSGRNVKEEMSHHRLVVKLKDEVQLTLEEVRAHLIEHLRKATPPPSDVDNISVGSLLTASDNDAIKRLIETAAKTDREYRPRNLPNYFVVETPVAWDTPPLLKALRSSPLVETAYLQLQGDDPASNPSNDPRAPSQQYLDAARTGIDARFVWPAGVRTGFPGTSGAGVRFVDMELGWTLNHEDLVAQNPVLLYGPNSQFRAQHGTSVLGVVAAADNNIGCIGIAHGVDWIGVVSYGQDQNRDIPNAILAAISDPPNKLRYGDVLLLEAQLVPTLLPVEVQDAEFDMIRLATALGIIVIEAAGNGSVDLDQFQDSEGRFLLRPGAFGYRDSLAILVGAATSTSHAKLPTSNFGSRVNCFGWGDGVVTTSSNVSGKTDMYREDFGFTSAAAAIVAGAAILVQGMADNRPARLSPVQMRTILGDRSIGTFSHGDFQAGGAVVDRIGVMPNLRAISQSILGT
jgi:serine protease